jgi:hypothetical protein
MSLPVLDGHPSPWQLWGGAADQRPAKMSMVVCHRRWTNARIFSH